MSHTIANWENRKRPLDQGESSNGNREKVSKTDCTIQVTRSIIGDRFSAYLFGDHVIVEMFDSDIEPVIKIKNLNMSYGTNMSDAMKETSKMSSEIEKVNRVMEMRKETSAGVMNLVVSINEALYYVMKDVKMNHRKMGCATVKRCATEITEDGITFEVLHINAFTTNCQDKTIMKVMCGVPSSVEKNDNHPTKGHYAIVSVLKVEVGSVMWKTLLDGGKEEWVHFNTVDSNDVTYTVKKMLSGMMKGTLDKNIKTVMSLNDDRVKAGHR